MVVVAAVGRHCWFVVFSMNAQESNSSAVWLVYSAGTVGGMISQLSEDCRSDLSSQDLSSLDGSAVAFLVP